MLERHLAHDALEDHHLVAQRHGIAVVEVDFELGRAAFVDHRIELQRGDFGIVVDFLDDVFVFGHRFQAIGLGRALARPERPRGGWIGRSGSELTSVR
jgi:hypothetical protein